MTENEFMRQTEAAVERMREMNARSKIPQSNLHKMPPSPSFVKINSNNTQQKQNFAPKKAEETPRERHEIPNPPQRQTQNSGFGIPLLDSILKDGDSTLILGLLLVLMSENSDKMLLFALIYILM